ncbi:hypothetical protein AGMMS50229_03720 [Campylobacterota bacterium]|nr:hypothetical protein AGMMS50229_03720 [Campylobacterota bacterium]
MGLTSWKYAPDGKIIKTDVTVAKNYLEEQEIKRLALLVSTFLDMAQMRAERHLPTTMEQWITFMSDFLKLNGYPELQGFGKISKDEADEKAIAEFSEFRTIQDRNYVSDFEKIMQQANDKKKKQ